MFLLLSMWLRNIQELTSLFVLFPKQIIDFCRAMVIYNLLLHHKPEASLCTYISPHAAFTHCSSFRSFLILNLVALLTLSSPFTNYSSHYCWHARLMPATLCFNFPSLSSHLNPFSWFIYFPTSSLCILPRRYRELSNLFHHELFSWKLLFCTPFNCF